MVFGFPVIVGMLSRGAGSRYTLEFMAPPSVPASPPGQANRVLRLTGEYQKRPLDAIDRFSEIIFGLIMVLAFTCSFSVAEGGRQEVRQMLVAALACNVAWGLVDGVMYVLTSVAERARRALVFQGIRAADPAMARAIVLAALPESVLSITDGAEADRMVGRIRALPEPERRATVSLTDLRGALESSILVVLATLPPTVPFLIVEDAARALRISNGLAVASLFLAGWSLGKATGVRAWLFGLSMVVLGSSLVAITIALGG
jgi:VIT1/CCC1 family predicted Fe2+/Mn2+ transporter